MRAVTLLYHDVISNSDFRSSGFDAPGADHYKLDIEEFKRQIDSVDQRHRNKAQDLTIFNNIGSEQPFFISFDDGGSSFLNPIADILEEYGWKGLFFISTDFIDTPGFLTRDQVAELHRRGHVIGSHSCSHPKKISECSREELIREWGESKRILSEIVGVEIESASVPGGFLSKDVEETAEEVGYKVLFTSEPQKKIYKTGDCFVVGRYSITRSTTLAECISLASGPNTFFQIWQYVYWNIKKFAKKYLGSFYRLIRNKIR